MPTLVCSTCRRPFDPDRSAALPFCSERCRQVDLHRWLTDAYRVPVQPADEETRDEEMRDEEPDST